MSNAENNGESVKIESPTKLEQMGLIAWFAGNRVASSVIVAFLLIAGFMVGSKLVIHNLPEVKVNSVFVEVPVPGSTPREVQDDVIEQIENAVIGLSNVDQVLSTSREGLGRIKIDLDPQADKDVALNNIKNAINSLTRITNPSVEEPQITVLPWVSEVITLAISSNLLSESELRREAERLRSSLIVLPELTVIKLQGARDQQISIDINENEMQKYGISIADINRAVRSQSANLTAGQISTANGDITLQIDDKRTTGAEFEDVILITKANGSVIRLRDVAVVRDAFVDDPMLTELDGERAIFLRIQSIGDQSLRVINNAVKEHLRSYVVPDNVNVEILINRYSSTSERLERIIDNAIIGMALVFLCLVLIFDLRLAFWTTLGIPLSFAGALMLFPFFGLTINLMSLFALFLMIGIVVDDAIVVGESIATERKRSDSALSAAIKGTKIVAGPLIVGALTTILALMPMAFITEAAWQTFHVVTVVAILVLGVSLLDAFFILPSKLAFENKWSAPPLSRWSTQINDHVDAIRDNLVMNSVTWSLRKVWLVIGIGVLLVILSLVLLRTDIVRFVFVNNNSRVAEMIQAEITLPPGTAFESTVDVSRQFSEAAARINEEFDGVAIRSLSITVGSILAMRGDDNDINGSNLATIRAYLNKRPDRKIRIIDTAEAWQKFTSHISGIERLHFVKSELRARPSISYSVQHPEPEIMEQVAFMLSNEIDNTLGIFSAYDTLTLGTKQFSFELTPVAVAAGLTSATLGGQIRRRVFGAEVERFQRGFDEVRVIVKLSNDEINTITDITELEIGLPNGKIAPISELATLTEVQDFAELNRIDGEQAILVEAYTDLSVSTPSQVRRILENGIINQLRNQFPSITIEPGGDARSEARIYSQLAIILPLAIIAIFAVMAAFLRSFWKPFLVVLGIPIGFSGAVILHWILGYEFSFVSMLGIIAVSGVTVNDSLLLTDRYNNIKKEHGGLPTIAVVAAAARHRFRAVFLTGLTTILGISPLLYESSETLAYLIPFIVSMLGGLVFTLFFVIFLLPALIVLIDEKNE